MNLAMHLIEQNFHHMSMLNPNSALHGFLFPQ